MRLRFVRDGSTHRRQLVLRTQRAEAIDPRMLRWLAKNNDEGLACSLVPKARHRGATEIRLDVEGLVSLRSYLRQTTLGTTAITGIAGGLAQAVLWCVTGGFNYFALLYDTRYVFVDKGAQPRFVFVPFAGLSFSKNNSPLAMLSALGDVERLHFADPNAAALSERVASFVQEQSGIFSLNSLREFVRVEIDLAASSQRTAGLVTDSKDAPVLHSHPPASCPQVAPEGYVLLSIATGRQYPLATDVDITVGRGDACGVRLAEHPSISRAHAVVRASGEEVTVRDLGSTNGTFVRGTRVLPRTDATLFLEEEFCLSNEPFCVKRA